MPELPEAETIVRGIRPHVVGKVIDRARVPRPDVLREPKASFGRKVAGRPVEAVYTSMVGSRSRANQDVWPSDPVPYLQAVDSPEVGPLQLRQG